MFILIVSFVILLFPLNIALSYGIDDLLKELDVPNWREKIADPNFLQKFQEDSKFRTVVALADARGYDWRYRIRAIRMLGHMGTNQAREALLEMFQDHFFHHECPSLKSYVAEALGDFPKSMRLMDILKEGLKDPEVLVREATAKSLGKIGMPESVKYLVEAFRNEKSLAVKIAIVNALRSINTSESVSFIKEIASDKSNKELLDAFGGSL